jgi:hypothetical protein
VTALIVGSLILVGTAAACEIIIRVARHRALRRRIMERAQ